MGVIIYLNLIATIIALIVTVYWFFKRDEANFKNSSAFIIINMFIGFLWPFLLVAFLIVHIINFISMKLNDFLKDWWK